MAVKRILIQDYSPKGSDVFFFDNNVWVNIYGALSNYNERKQKVFSRFLRDIQIVGATIVTNSMILSEFTNRFFRFYFEQWKKSHSKFSADYKRDFVGTEPYKESAEEVTIYLKKILSVAARFPDEFNALNLDNVLERLNFIDFNDSYILELATLRNYKIVTDDRDFVDHDIHSATVITP